MDQFFGKVRPDRFEVRAECHGGQSIESPLLSHTIPEAGLHQKYGNDDFLGHAIFMVDVFQKLGVLLEVSVRLGYHIFFQIPLIDGF